MTLQNESKGKFKKEEVNVVEFILENNGYVI